MTSQDDAENLTAQVKAAFNSRSPINIIGGNSKQFLGVTKPARELRTTDHSGVINYEPTELVVTVRAGTPLDALTAELAAQGQMLPFEPPAFPASTIGGVLACGLSGPRRPYSGSARDFVLGMRVINGRGQALRFGGEVMKNVAGYDVSRLQVGAFGTLGVLLDASMKVLPIPECEQTLHRRLERDNNLEALIALARQPMPVSATLVQSRDQYIRLSGSTSAVAAAVELLGGDKVAAADEPWQSVRDHTHPFFSDPKPLWRLSVPDYADDLALEGDWLIEWGGAQRWLKSDLPAEQIFAAAQQAQGHATRFSPTSDASAVFQPLQGAMRTLQQRVRDSFDPLRLFNPGRFHPEIDADEIAHPTPVGA